MSFRVQMRYMNPYDIHKALINDYILNHPGDTSRLRRDSSKDKTDDDILRDNHQFLWSEEAPDTWEEQFAKKYYDKLFKEYCISDLTLYKDNKIALRWRTEQEVVVGKGQFICANKRCNCELDLKTWEVNFAYQEKGEKRNALVKIRLCPNCSDKLNYHSKKREVKKKRPKKIGQIKMRKDAADNPVEIKRRTDDVPSYEATTSSTPSDTTSPWENAAKPIENKSRDEEMEDYLQELLL